MDELERLKKEAADAASAANALADLAYATVDYDSRLAAWRVADEAAAISAAADTEWRAAVNLIKKLSK